MNAFDGLTCQYVTRTVRVVDNRLCGEVAISILIGSYIIQQRYTSLRTPLAVAYRLRHSAPPRVHSFAALIPGERIFRLMFRPLELFIGLRYVRAKRRNHFI